MALYKVEPELVDLVAMALYRWNLNLWIWKPWPLSRRTWTCGSENPALPAGISSTCGSESPGQNLNLWIWESCPSSSNILNLWIWESCPSSRNILNLWSWESCPSSKDILNLWSWESWWQPEPLDLRILSFQLGYPELFDLKVLVRTWTCGSENPVLPAGKTWPCGSENPGKNLSLWVWESSPSSRNILNLWIWESCPSSRDALNLWIWESVLPAGISRTYESETVKVLVRTCTCGSENPILPAGISWTCGSENPVLPAGISWTCGSENPVLPAEISWTCGSENLVLPAGISWTCGAEIPGENLNLWTWESWPSSKENLNPWTQKSQPPVIIAMACLPVGWIFKQISNFNLLLWSRLSVDEQDLRWKGCIVPSLILPAPTVQTVFWMFEHAKQVSDCCCLFVCCCCFLSMQRSIWTAELCVFMVLAAVLDFELGHFQIYRGYVDDPRNTDNAWMETIAMNFHDECGDSVAKFKLHAGLCVCAFMYGCESFSYREKTDLTLNSTWRSVIMKNNNLHLASVFRLWSLIST